jgi:serine/threonine protein kinase
MRHATESHGANVIVKLLYPGSNELPILQHLHSIKSPYNHTIPLIGTVKLNVGTFIFLPEATPLDLGFALGVHSKVVDFSRQLIEGVAFLHRYNIAHLDLKPQNIVTLQDQLFLIDFDISVCVDGPDALADHWCGTPEWMAPEVGHGPYSPIRADLWSCGLVLRYIAGKGATNPFAKLTEELLNKNPLLRPLLYLGDGGSK